MLSLFYPIVLNYKEQFTLSEKELIERCCKQDLRAQSELYQLFADKLFHVCLKYSKNYEDAEDTLQDSFLSIFSKIHQYKKKGSFEGWMKRVVINTALQKYRSKAMLNTVPEENIEEGTGEINFEKENISVDYLLSLIQELPDRYRLVFNLYVLDRFSHKEIAAMLKISEGTSKSNLSRERCLLKQKIEANQHIEK
ncbi:RNA polymerase sigma factor [Tenacibaculum maritimum]|uniref:RNA polymerase sigma factor n=1 Tax=Tenacibaculum maritimum TaxID=107401 RepID=UPI00387777AA